MQIPSEKSIYFLYTDKWWISAKWSGASVNVINEMFVLSRKYSVFYNDILVNDLFGSNGVLDEDAFIQRYTAYVNEARPAFSSYLKKILKPSRLYYASFYRAGNDESQTRFFLDELMEPKIYSHNFQPDVWRNHYVGFQNQTAKDFAERDQLRTIGDDGTLSYSNIDRVPTKNFVRLQSCIRKPISFDDQSLIKKRSEFRRSLNSAFVIGISGTITEHTSPFSHIKAIEKLRQRYPGLNITFVIYSLNILVDLPKKDWIVIQKYSKSDQDEALCAVDVLLNTWHQESQHYSASNKILEAISYGIPIVTPRTAARVEQLGEEYPLYHKFECEQGRLSPQAEQEVYHLLEKCLDEKFREEVSKYLTKRAQYFSVEAVASFYAAQLRRVHKSKVLLINHSLNVGGVEQYTIDIVQALREMDVYLYSELESSTQRLDYIRAICPSVQFVHDYDGVYDFVFLNSYPTQFDQLSDCFERLTRANPAVKFIPITHTDIHAFTENIGQFFDRVYKHVTVADLITRKIGSALRRDVGEQSVLITPSIACAGAKFDGASSLAGFKYRLAYFGRVVPIKGVLQLIKYFVRYVQEHPQSSLALDICGPFASAHYHDACLSSIPSGCSDRVKIHNRVFDSCERDAIFGNIDYLIYATAMDGVPYTYLEAMNAGRPVISTPVGGIEHLIEDGVNGFLMRFPDLYLPDFKVKSPYNELVKRLDANESQNYSIFKSAIDRAYSSYEAYSKISGRARETVTSRFQLLNFAKKIRDVIYGA